MLCNRVYENKVYIIICIYSWRPTSDRQQQEKGFQQIYTCTCKCMHTWKYTGNMSGHQGPWVWTAVILGTT